MLSNRLAALALLLASAGAAFAANDGAIRIRADFMQLDVKNGSSEYRGNVLIEKGDITLSGDNVSISKHDGGVSRITITGSPARYRQTGDKPTQAQSRLMLFDVSSNILTLKTDARLQQNQQRVESQFIQFDTDKQVLLAGSDNKQGAGRQRVNIILGPDNPPGQPAEQGNQP